MGCFCRVFLGYGGGKEVVVGTEEVRIERVYQVKRGGWIFGRLVLLLCFGRGAYQKSEVKKDE